MRTKKTLKNMITSVGLTLIVGILGFIKVRVFVNGLSNDIYSLNQLFYQIFSYLAITDIGFSLLLNQKLYKAFAKKDYEEINNIYSTSKKFYNIIGIVIFSLALIISFFVHIFTKAELSYFYIQIIFIIFIIRNVVDYFFVAPRFVIEADQKSYKINFLVKSIKVIETIIEIILVLIGVDYLFILIPGIIITIGIDTVVNKKVFKEYPWLKNNKKFNKNYLKGTKDMIWRKGADLLNSNTDIILISSFINPISVIIYSSYNYITKFLSDIIYLVSTAITPSYANVMFKEDNEKKYLVFTEVYIFFLFIASFITIMLYGFLNSLIGFWVGEEYIVNNFTLFLFCFILFQVIVDKATTIIINSQCLFKETKFATVLEAILNIAISLSLIRFLGITGVLLGTVISRLFTTFIYNAIYIFKNIFKKNPIHYFALYFLVIVINILFILTFNYMNLQFTNVLSWFIYVLLFALIIGIILLLIFGGLFKSFRTLFKRGIEFIKVKGKYTEI